MLFTPAILRGVVMNFLLKTCSLIALLSNILNASDFVELEESYAAADAVKKSQIPKPEGKAWEKLQKHFGLEIKEIDSTLVQVTFPKGWSIKPDPKRLNDTRWQKIYDHKDRETATVFLKRSLSGYDDFGSTSFNEDAVDRLITEEKQ
jgi:hypothetical protein